MSMKKFMRHPARCSVIALLSTCGFVLPPSAVAEGAIKAETWEFTSGNSPVIAEHVTNSAHQCVAVVSPGQFGSGWLAEDSGALGGVTGVWDLGRHGTIACNGISGLIGNPGQERVFTVKVKQLNDPIYSDFATVFVTGAALQNAKIITNNSSTFGVWITQESRWKAPAVAAVDQVTIVSAYYGSLVDQVSVEASLVSVPAPILTIRQVGNQIEVSWSSAFSGMALEATGNLQDAESWSLVEAPVQTSGGVSSVTLTPPADAQFYRLKQP